MHLVPEMYYIHAYCSVEILVPQCYRRGIFIYLSSHTSFARFSIPETDYMACFRYRVTTRGTSIWAVRFRIYVISDEHVDELGISALKQELTCIDRTILLTVWHLPSVVGKESQLPSQHRMETRKITYVGRYIHKLHGQKYSSLYTVWIRILIPLVYEPTSRWDRHCPVRGRTPVLHHAMLVSFTFSDSTGKWSSMPSKLPRSRTYKWQHGFPALLKRLYIYWGFLPCIGPPYVHGEICVRPQGL